MAGRLPKAIRAILAKATVEHSMINFLARRGVVWFLISLLSAGALAGEHYVSPDGSNISGDGSYGNPWATLNYAANQVPDDGSTIIMKDGVYVGAQSVGRHFTQPLTVRAQTPYKAEIVSSPDSTRAFHIYDASNITFSGLNIHGSGGTASEYVMHLSTENTHHITFENSLIHNSYNNDVIKINDKAHHITFRGCMTYNANSGGDEHFDINTVQDITLEGNIFLNDFEGSGRVQLNNTHPYIVIKNSSNTNPDYTRRINLRRNIFLNWSGLADQSFLLIGEDGKAFWEAQDVMVENNLLLLHSSNSHVGAFMVKGGARNIQFRANTISGHPVGGSAYGMRLQQIGPNPPMEDISFFNNIFSDPAGMVDFSDGYDYNAINEKLVNNLYWSNGGNIPADSWSIFDPDSPRYDDPQRIVADPGLANPDGLLIPRWDPELGQFVSGYGSLAEEFERLVLAYASFPKDSAVIDAADMTEMPDDDIFGRLRSGTYDVGALEQLPFLPGDCNQDYAVDETDLATLEANWSPDSTDKLWADGDFDGDGDVDEYDRDLLLLYWAPGTYLVPGYLDKLAAVPEPALLGYLAAGALWLLRLRGRRSS
jgi:hypothetical protein